MAENLTPDGDAEEQEKKSLISRFIAWLADSYNGLFKIVIQPQLPSLRVTGFMLISFLIGLIWAYAVMPVNYYGAAPHQLSQSNRDTYIKLVASSYASGLYPNTETIVDLLDNVEDPNGRIAALIEIEAAKQPPTALLPMLRNIQGLVTPENAGTKAPSEGSIVGEILSYVIAIVVFLVIINVFALLWGLLIGTYVRLFWELIRPKSDEDKQLKIEANRRKQEIKDRKHAQEEMDKAAGEAAASDLGPPLMTKPSIYTKGRSFDDSFAIEDTNDMFLGECGATIAKSLGAAKELAAVEIWLFDKEDFVRTLTKLYVSEHVFNDPAARAELDGKVENPATDIVRLVPGAMIELESKMLRVRAKVIDAKPGTDGTLPPNSHFEGLTIQMQAWEKAGQGGAFATPPPVPAAAGGLPDMSSYEVGPPPTMPSGTPPPPAGGLPDMSSYEVGPPPAMPSGMQLPPSQPDAPPLSPPPMGQPPQKPDDDDDDPFGGTGDFTPINR